MSDCEPAPASRRFVLELGRAMHALGSPSYRVEDSMVACAQALGMQGSFFATPTAIFAELAAAGGQAATTLLRVQPGEHDLGKLADLYTVRNDVVGGLVSADDGLLRIAAVLGRPASQGPLASLPAYALTAAAAAPFLGGGWVEIACAGAIGLLVGALSLAAARLPRFRRVFEPSACAAAVFAAYACARLFGSDPGIASLASIVPLLPGLTFTTALAELAMRHLAAGSARLLGTLALLLTMAVGVGIGVRLGQLAFGPGPEQMPVPVADFWQVPALFAAAVSFAVLLRARPAQFPAAVASVLCAFAGSRLGMLVFERELAAFVGALSVSLCANLYARWRRAPAAVVRTPGLLLLVPGSLGLRGLTVLLRQDVVHRADLAFQMLLVGSALVAGMLVASVLLPPPLDVEPESAA